MGAIAQPKPPSSRPAAAGRRLVLIEGTRRAAKLHLATYTVGSALFWGLWAAISVTADTWYWWATVPVAAWTLVLLLHLWHAYGRSRT